VLSLSQIWSSVAPDPDQVHGEKKIAGSLVITVETGNFCAWAEGGGWYYGTYALSRLLPDCQPPGNWQTANQSRQRYQVTIALRYFPREAFSVGLLDQQQPCPLDHVRSGRPSPQYLTVAKPHLWVHRSFISEARLDQWQVLQTFYPLLHALTYGLHSA